MQLRRGWLVPPALLTLLIAAATASAEPPAPVACDSCFVPPLRTSFQVQLGGDEIDTTVRARMFDLDWQTDKEVVADLRARGRKVFCYISAGSWENYRPDKDRFPQDVIGSEYGGYPDERWIDVRRIDVLEPIMLDRMQACKDAGFDGIWLDNVDGYEMETGFPITGDEQLAYNATLANDAHARGLGAGFNNDPHQLPQMAAYFDWVLFEIDRDDIKPCYFRLSCHTLDAFRRAGKASFVLDYVKRRQAKMCRVARKRHFNAIRKDLDLTAFRAPCR